VHVERAEDTAEVHPPRRESSRPTGRRLCHLCRRRTQRMRRARITVRLDRRSSGRRPSDRRNVTRSGATGPVPQGAAAAAPGEVSGGITDRFPSVAAAEETNCSPHDLHVADVTTMRPSGQATALALALPLSHDSNGFVPARVRALGVCAYAPRARGTSLGSSTSLDAISETADDCPKCGRASCARRRADKQRRAHHDPALARGIVLPELRSATKKTINSPNTTCDVAKNRFSQVTERRTR
jgi:hypothetical protein